MDAILPDDTPPWAIALLDEVKQLREQIAPVSLTVNVSEAAALLGKSPRTIRHWHATGKMPKAVNPEGTDLMWSRAAIVRMTAGVAGGGRPRKNT